MISKNLENTMKPTRIGLKGRGPAVAALVVLALSLGAAVWGSMRQDPSGRAPASLEAATAPGGAARRAKLMAALPAGVIIITSAVDTIIQAVSPELSVGASPAARAGERNARVARAASKAKT